MFSSLPRPGKRCRLDFLCNTMEMKSGKCPKCSQRNVSKCVSAEDLGVGSSLHMGGLDTVIYGCGDCHYTETYLSDEDRAVPLEEREGWERVSAPSAGPFR